MSEHMVYWPGQNMVYIGHVRT